MSNTKQKTQIYKRIRQLINRSFNGEIPMPFVILNLNDQESSESQVADGATCTIIFPLDFDFTNRQKVDSFILHHLRFIHFSLNANSFNK